MGVELSLTFLTNFTAAQQEHINLAFPAGLAPDTFAFELAWLDEDWLELVPEQPNASIPSVWCLEEFEEILTMVESPDHEAQVQRIIDKLKELIANYPASSVTYAWHG